LRFEDFFASLSHTPGEAAWFFSSQAAHESVSRKDRIGFPSGPFIACATHRG